MLMKTKSLSNSEYWASLVAQTVKNSASNTGDLGSVPGLGRSLGEGNGNPLQYSCPENPWTEEPGGLQSVWSQRVGHDRETDTFFTFIVKISAE